MKLTRLSSLLKMIMRLYLRAVLLVSMLLPVIVFPANAQDALPVNTWTPQLRIPDFGNESSPPYLVSDMDGNVYAFNTQPDGQSIQAIFVRKWSVEQSWSPPVDILLSPLSDAPVIFGAYLDPGGVIHLIFFSGNETYGAIYYTWAPAYLADQPQAWANPVLIADNSTGIGTALAGDGNGNLFVVFGGKQEGVGLYSVISQDSGKSWSAPQLITLMQDTNLLPNGTKLAVDPQGRLHVVWSEVDQTGIDQVVYYDNLSADHSQWGQPVVLARKDAGDYKAAWPSIIAYKGTLMVIYQDSNPATRWMRQSTDGGQTWSDPVRPWPHVGEYRWADLLVDSSDRLHIILGNRNGECCHGMWHAVWLGDHWGPLEPIVMGPKTLQFDPSAPQSIISQGNVLLATWWTDTGGGPRNGVWYSYAILDAPELPHKPLPRPLAAETIEPTMPFMATPSATSTPTPAPTEIPVNSLGKDFTSRPPSDNPGIPVIASIFPISLLVIATFIFRKKTNSHK